MNIGIDGTCWQNTRGFGRFTRELLTALFAIETQHRFYLFVDQAPDEAMAWPHVKYVRVYSDRPLTESATARGRRRARDLARMYRAVSKCPLDVMFFPAVYSWFPVPVRLPTMVTLHDAIPEHFPKMVFPERKSRLFWTTKVKLAVWQCSRVLTVSQAAKEEIAEYVGVHDSRIDVISEAPGSTFRLIDDPDAGLRIRQEFNIPRNARVIGYVGGMAPHKNLHRLLDGFSLALRDQELDDLHLLIVGDFAGGGFHSNYDSLQERVNRDQDLKSRVHFAGFVPDERLVEIYNDAMALIMPSLSEGFGLPAIEAMACGTPVLASNRGSLPEVVGDAGLFFDPYDVNDMCRAIIELSCNHRLRRQLAETAKSRAATFTWPKAAQLTMGYLESMMKLREHS
jgi:glycosyltransferase involved in cell wall biosynthesis